MQEQCASQNALNQRSDRKETVNKLVFTPASEAEDENNSQYSDFNKFNPRYDYNF